MKREIQVFALAVQFLTRLPVPRDLPFSEARLTEATKFFPLVGLLVGLIGAAVLWAGAALFPMPVAVILSVVATVAATGAFHEDGLADAADGLGGGMTRARALEIMRDSRIGTYGAVTLGLTLALKIAALAALPLAVALPLVALGHGISRYAPVAVVFTSAYAREEGAKFVAPTISAGGHALAALQAVLLLAGLVSLIGPAALAGVALGVVLALGMRRIYLRKLGGFTGDCLGATQQMAELGLILGVLAWL
jgi:adenosylcobinamide-GDP ribazoletransferase